MEGVPLLGEFALLVFEFLAEVSIILDDDLELLTHLVDLDLEVLLDLGLELLQTAFPLTQFLPQFGCFLFHLCFLLLLGIHLGL